MMKRRVFVSLLSAVAVSLLPQTAAQASAIMQETFKGDATITRNVTAPRPGAYLLILKNGSVGPHAVEQCDIEGTNEEKSECLSRNLSENVDQDFSRAKEAEIKINGRWVQGITNARSFLTVPVTLKGGTNKIDILLKGRSTSRLTVSVEPAPQAAIPPEAAFLLSRLTSPIRAPFTFDAKESFSPNGNSLRYSWNFGDGAIESGKPRVSHRFSKPGTYSVQLTVTDQTTRLSSSFSVDVTVLSIDKTKPPKNQKPKPVIQYALDTVNPLHVTFDGAQSTDDGTIVSYSWKIFQETDHNNRHDHRITAERTGAQFDYVFPRAGSYTVRLTVKDNQGAEAATERVVSTSDIRGLVRDESLLGPKKYYGSTGAENKTIETLTLASPRLAVLKIKNADGLEHPIESCSSAPWPEKIACLFQNTVNRAYVALYRVNSANVYINGRRVTDGTSIGKQKAYFESVVSLQTSNTVDIQLKGWPTAFIELELQSLEVNEAPIVYVTHSDARRGIPQTVEFDASQSVDMNDHIMSYRFQAFKADGSIAIDTDWQGASYAALEFTESGTFTVMVSARDTFGAVGTKSIPITIESNQVPIITASYVVLSNQAPYQVRVTATASYPDGDALQYSFAYSTGQISGFQDSPQGLTSFAAAGQYSVDVTARDANGGTATFTLPITVGGNLLPIANFDFVTDRGGYAPLTITVDASPSSDPDDATETLRYFWTFGDNSPRVEGKILSHTFINQGQYTVTLSVLDPKRGLSTKSRAAFAWRTTPPNPVLIANPRVGPASLTIDFDASQSTPGASPIASYLFDYNDGTFESSLTPFKTHTFTQPGIYNVGLIVYDTDGNGNIGGQTIYVFDGKKPSAAIQVVSSDVITPARFELQGSAVSPNPLGTITDYKWTLPNGTVQTGASLIYTTSTNGNFNIQLQVKDSYGYWSDPATIDLSAASGTLPIAQITADKTRIALGQAVKLSGLNSYTSNGQANLVSYEWTLPNGTKIYGPEKTVTLSATGLKTISLIVTDLKGYVSNPSTIQIQVDARQTPTAVITASTSGTVIPVTATANGLQSTTPNPGATITGYEWRLQAPDATPPLDIQAFGPEIQGVLTWPVNYTLSLRVFDSAGAVSGWVSHTFGPLLNTPPIAVITPSSVIDTAPTTVTLSSIGSTDPDGHNIINAHWIFSDGGEYWGLIAPYYISAPGNYTATVRVLDQYGAWSDPVTVPITLNANLPPVALMTAAPDANNRFNFTFDASTSFDLDGTVARYDWFFSDGFVSLGAGSAITHAFSSAGTWRAGVNVFDNKGAMATVHVEVTVSANLPPVARFIATPLNHENGSFHFDASASTDDRTISSYRWELEPGQTRLGRQIDYTFQSPGQKAVRLIVTDNDAESSSHTETILVLTSQFNIIASTATGSLLQTTEAIGQISLQELPSQVSFQTVGLDSSEINLPIKWDFGDGVTANDLNPLHIYRAPGVYNVKAQLTLPNGQVESRTVRIGTSDHACQKKENDNVCFFLQDHRQSIIPESASTITVRFKDTPASGLATYFVSTSVDEIAEPVDITSSVTQSGNDLIVPASAVRAMISRNYPEVSLNISGELVDGTYVQGTVDGLRIADRSVTLTLTGGSTPAQVKLKSNESGEVFELAISDSTVRSGLIPGVYSVNGKSEDGFINGSFSIAADEHAVIELSPIPDLFQSLSASVIKQVPTLAVLSAPIAVPLHPTLAKTQAAATKVAQPVTSLATSQTENPCLLVGTGCPLAYFTAAMIVDQPIRDRYRVNHGQAFSGISDAYENVSLSQKDGATLRGLAPELSFHPGDRVEIQCRSISTTWLEELFYPDAQAALNLWRELQQLNQKSLGALNARGTAYNALPYSLKLTLTNNPLEDRNNRGDVLPVKIYPIEFTYPEYNSYFATQEAYYYAYTAVLRASTSWDAAIQQDSLFQYRKGLASNRNAAFTVNAVLTQYQNGQAVRQNNKDVEMHFSSPNLQNVLFHGEKGKTDSGFWLSEAPPYLTSFQQKYTDAWQPDPWSAPFLQSNIRSFSIEIPADWQDYRLAVKIDTVGTSFSGPNTFPGSSREQPSEQRNGPNYTVDCRPAPKNTIKVMKVSEPYQTITELARVVGNYPVGQPDSNCTTADCARDRVRFSTWQDFFNKALGPQMDVWDYNTAVPAATKRTIAQKTLHRNIAQNLMSNPVVLFPMNIDRDLSAFSNYAFKLLMLEDSGTYSANRLQDSDLDIQLTAIVKVTGDTEVDQMRLLVCKTENPACDTDPLEIPLTISGRRGSRSQWGNREIDITIPYAALRDALTTYPDATDLIRISFMVTGKTSTGAAVPSDNISSEVNTQIRRVYDLKPLVKNVNTADQDPGRLGLYSGRASTYVEYKLREFIKNLITRKQTLDSDTTKTASERFNVFINDGSLPFGTAFSPHRSHDNGKVLDIRPLGNSGATEQHYDFNAGLRRRKDLALLWAESAYRHDECIAYAADSPFRQTCLDNASGTFITKYEQTNGFGSFDAAKKRIVDWVNINQELGDIGIPGDKLSIYFSSGLMKFGDLCVDMVGTYSSISGRLIPEGGCDGTVSPLGIKIPQAYFQIQMLNGRLPNTDDIVNSTNDNLTGRRLKTFKWPESGHFDHFHIEATP